MRIGTVGEDAAEDGCPASHLNTDYPHRFIMTEGARKAKSCGRVSRGGWQLSIGKLVAPDPAEGAMHAPHATTPYPSAPVT